MNASLVAFLAASVVAVIALAWAAWRLWRWAAANLTHDGDAR